MQTNNNQKIKFPPGRAEKTQPDHVNNNLENSITTERRFFIERLKAEADDFNDLMIDTLNMADLLSSIVMFKDNMSVDFYYNLQSAFNNAIESNSDDATKYFRTYSELMKLLMSLMTNYELIQNKANEYTKLADDLETIDYED